MVTTVWTLVVNLLGTKIRRLVYLINENVLEYGNDTRNEIERAR